MTSHSTQNLRIGAQCPLAIASRWSQDQSEVSGFCTFQTIPNPIEYLTLFLPVDTFTLRDLSHPTHRGDVPIKLMVPPERFAACKISRGKNSTERLMVCLFRVQGKPEEEIPLIDRDRSKRSNDFSR